MSILTDNQALVTQATDGGGVADRDPLQGDALTQRIATTVRVLAAERKISTQQIAAALDVSVGEAKARLSGAAVFYVGDMLALARLFRVEPEELMGRVNEEPPSADGADEGVEQPDADDVEILTFSVERTDAEWAAEYLMDLPTVVSFDHKRAVSVFQASDGNVYRQAGHIWVSPFSKRRFRIWLYDGATEADLKYLEKQIRYARHGYFSQRGWKLRETDSGARVYLWSWGRTWGPAQKDDEEYAYKVLECTDSDCRDTYHTAVNTDDVLHTGHESVDNSVCGITLERFGDREDWRLSVEVGDGEFTADEAASFTSDLMWMSEECRRLNAKRQAALAEGVAA